MSPEFWSVVAVLSFWCWVATVGIGIASAFPKGRRYDARAALYWGGLAFVFGIIWVVGLTKA
jgi:hypothetical protein